MQNNNIKEKVRQLQRKLYLAAKGNSKRRFHAIYDKVYRQDVLGAAWKRVKANDGAGGIDQISIEDIEKYGVEKFLNETGEMLRTGKYQLIHRYIVCHVVSFPYLHRCLFYPNSSVTGKLGISQLLSTSLHLKKKHILFR